MNVLDCPMGPNDASAFTVGDYLRALLTSLWDEEESFSGKRPFGNSGWKNDVYAALVKADLVRGDLDDDGDLNWADEPAADELVHAAIQTMGGASR